MTVEALLDDSQQKRALSELVQLLMRDDDCLPVLNRHGADATVLSELFWILMRAGAAQTLKGCFVPCHALAEPWTLDFLLRKRSAGQLDESAVARLIEFYGAGGRDLEALRDPEPDRRISCSSSSEQMPGSDSEPSPGHSLGWRKVRRIASEYFLCSAAYSAAMNWAETGWAVLERRGLTVYRTRPEWYHAKFRMLLLVGIYLDYANVAHDAWSPVEYGKAFSLDRFVGGQLWARLAGRKFRHRPTDDEEILGRLVESHRDEVADALLLAFDGDERLHELLWTHTDPLRRPDDSEHGGGEGRLDPWANYPAQFRAYRWVRAGCPRVCQRISLSRRRQPGAATK